MKPKSSSSDGRVQFSLRLPADLHEKLVARAGMIPLNSFIVGTLSAALNDETLREAERLSKQLQELQEEIKEQNERGDRQLEAMARLSMSKLRALVLSTVREAVFEALAHKPPQPPEKS